MWFQNSRSVFLADGAGGCFCGLKCVFQWIMKFLPGPGWDMLILARKMWFLSQLWDKDGELRAVHPGSVKERGYSNLLRNLEPFGQSASAWHNFSSQLMADKQGNLSSAWRCTIHLFHFNIMCCVFILHFCDMTNTFFHTFWGIPHAKVPQLSRPHQKMLVLSSDAGRSRRAGEHVPSQQPPAEVIVQFHASDFSGDPGPWTRSWSWPRQNVIHWYTHLSNVHSFIGPANIFRLADGVGVSMTFLQRNTVSKVFILFLGIWY